MASVDVSFGVGGMSRVTDSQRWEGTFGSIWTNPAQTETSREGCPGPRPGGFSSKEKDYNLSVQPVPLLMEQHLV